ncbi:MAG: hypothetical protein AB2A00_05200 [Myxococcota bacterium]
MMGVVLLAGLSLAAQVDTRPSVAVLKLEAKAGVSPDVADLLGGNLVNRVRNKKVFSRVLAAKDLEMLLGFEQQKQLLQCEETSCLTEIAGALGVDYLIIGSLGRLGSEAWIFNASLINTRNAQTAGSVSEVVPGKDELVLGQQMENFVNLLLRDLPNAAGAPAVVATPAAAPAATTTPVATSQPVPADEGGAALSGVALMAAGGVGLALSAGLLLVGLAGGAGSTTIFGISRVSPESLLQFHNGLAIFLVYLSGWTVLAAGVTLGVLGGVVSVGMLGGGVALR